MNDSELNIIKQILEQYSLGELTTVKAIERRAEHLQSVYKLEMSTGIYFLKSYHEMNNNILGGLKLMDQLYQKNFPVLKLFVTNKGDYCAKVNEKSFAIFEWMDLKEKFDITKDEAFEFGKILGQLHTLAEGIEIEGDNLNISVDHLKELLKLQYDLIKDKLDIVDFAIQEVEKLTPPGDQPKGICHREYSLSHVRFDEGKVAKVIDWDLAAQEFYIYDLALAMGDMRTEGELDFEKLKMFINGYESVRPLTQWEKEHLFQAQVYGNFKYLIWEFSPDEVAELGFKGQSLEGISELQNLGEAAYIEKLS
jgi:homoserine kinase type II